MKLGDPNPLEKYVGGTFVSWIASIEYLRKELVTRKAHRKNYLPDMSGYKFYSQQIAELENIIERIEEDRRLPLFKEAP